jgi:uncharacterized membrane protein
MVRQVQVTVRNSRCDSVLELLASDKCARLCMGVVHFDGPTHTLILLKCIEKRLFRLLAELEGAGIGDLWGTVDVLQVVTTKPVIRSNLSFKLNKKRRYAFTDRVPVEEIYESIDADSHLTFNFIALTVFAGMIAGLGLATDSDATVVASMLVSPLMNPILLITFGAAIKDREFVQRGLYNELVGVVITLFTGFVIGVCIAQFYGPDCEHYSPTGWCLGLLRKDEMASRGQALGLVPGFFIACPAGAAVAIAITAGGGAAAFVGVAIAVALLPPLVNAGMSFGLAMVYWIQPRGDYPGGSSYEEQHYFLRIALYSFLLFLLNMTCIFISAYGIFKLKRVEHLPARSSKWVSESREISRRMSSTTLLSDLLDENERQAARNYGGSGGDGGGDHFQAHGGRNGDDSSGDGGGGGSRSRSSSRLARPNSFVAGVDLHSDERGSLEQSNSTGSRGPSYAAARPPSPAHSDCGVIGLVDGGGGGGGGAGDGCDGGFSATRTCS